MVEAAYRKGLTDFGVSGHADFSFCLENFGMTDQALKQYKEELYRLREEYAGKMNLYIGIEPVSYTHLDVYKRQRNVSMDEISDGRLYGLNDMVKADCRDCEGCSACCRGMGTSIVLDPLDIYRLTAGLGESFEKLLAGGVELNLADGLILPNLRMAGEKEQCVFLDERGRCGIHPFRPGICRLFPLGRFYENGSFRYFLQVNECRRENRGKVKVRKWIDTPDVKQYDQFISCLLYTSRCV